MSRSVEQCVADILQSIDRCQRYVDALDSDDPNVVDMAEDAVERNLQIIGEAANHLPAEITDAHPEIAWPQFVDSGTSSFTNTSALTSTPFVT